jgi:hypothetical protein
MTSVDIGAIEGEIDRIRSLDLEGLRREWRRLYHSEPPRISRDLLVLGLGYRLHSLVELAARIRAEHEATSTALKSSVEHAMKAGDLLIEAKAQLKHGQWLPWLAEHCVMSERTAQLYMRIAKNRATIEANIRNGVADLTLGQAAALMMMTADVKKLFDFMKKIEATDDPAQIINVCIEHGVGYISDPSYNMFAGRTDEEKREWHLFVLFLVECHGWHPQAAAYHVEWVLQRPFQNVADWFSDDGDRFRSTNKG